MTHQNADELIQEYRACQAVQSCIDFSSKGSINASNKAADRMRAIATTISKSPEAVTLFGNLLAAQEPQLQLWAAHHLLEIMNPDNSTKSSALSIIENASRGDDANALGERLWLDAWRSSNAI